MNPFKNPNIDPWPLLDDLGVLYTRCPRCDVRLDLPQTAGEAFDLINAHECEQP